MIPLTFRPLFQRFYLLASAAFLAVNAHAATYYVDSNLGNDTNPGTSTSAPWQSLKRAEQIRLLPGDQLLFVRGGVWSGDLVLKGKAGTSASPIVIGAYGTDTKKPLINGIGTEAPMELDNDTYITVQDFALTNFVGTSFLDADGKVAPPEGNCCGILVRQYSGALNNISLLNNEIYNVAGFSNHPLVGGPRGGPTLNKSKCNQYTAGAIFLNLIDTDGVTIDGNYIHDCTGTGIFGQSQHTLSKLLIQHNQIKNIGSDGIEILKTQSPIVQYNSCISAGNNCGAAPFTAGFMGCSGMAVAGMWAFDSSDVLFQYNYCQGTHQIKWDGQAWDFDEKLTGTCIYQYNYSRDNEGGFILSTHNGKDPKLTMIVRYNISVNDGSKQGAGEGFFNKWVDQYNNNIFYRTDGKGYMLAAPAGAWNNNIFYTTASTDITYVSKRAVFNNNCFYGHTPVGPGSNPVLKDPLFIDASSATSSTNLACLKGFFLQPGSPCLGAGMTLPIPANGATDFWSNAIPTGTPNIGPLASSSNP